MCFFAKIMLAVLFLQDTKKHNYELLHTKPITAGKYVLGKISKRRICNLFDCSDYYKSIILGIVCYLYKKTVGLKCGSGIL